MRSRACQSSSDELEGFTNVDDESSWDRGRVDPFASEVLDLKSSMIGCLKELGIGRRGLVHRPKYYNSIMRHTKVRKPAS